MKTPMQIKKELDSVVIGQEHAKKVLAIEVFKHYLRVNNDYELASQNKVINKSNILMTGVTGSGKTYLAQTLANIINVPFAIADATTITQAGYVGDDVENILLKLIEASDWNINSAEKGIIYIDEIDKIARKGENPSITRDVSGEGVQQSLLKMLEGTISSVPPNGGRKHPQQQCIQINTKNILFIGGGSFEGIEGIVRERIKTQLGSKSFGFSNTSGSSKDIREIDEREVRNSITRNDLKKFGLLPELLGRFSTLTNLLPLELNDLIDILKLKNGIIQEYKNIFDLQNKKLSFDTEALEEIAGISIKENTGARGLRAIIETIMLDIMFNAPSENKKSYRISKSDVNKLYENILKIA